MVFRLCGKFGEKHCHFASVGEVLMDGSVLPSPLRCAVLDAG